MIVDVNESQYRGKFWRVRAFFRGIWFLLRNQEYVLIGVRIRSVDSAKSVYDLKIRYSGLKNPAVLAVVQEWVDFESKALANMNIAQSILRGPKDN
jgi:hypothetical protein